MSANSTFSNGKSKSSPYLYWNAKLFFYLTGDMDMRFASLVLSACVLTACGGGGGSGSDPGGVPTLSTTQAALENFYLSPNVGYNASGYLPPTGVPTAGRGYYFQDTVRSLSKSPSSGAQTLTGASPVDLTRTPLGLSGGSTDWILADGEFYKPTSPVTSEVSYLNGEVVEMVLSEDLKHRLASQAITQLVVTPLTGPIVSAAGQATALLPAEMYTNPALTKSGAVWGSGSAYTTSTARYTTDIYLVYANPLGTGTPSNSGPAPFASNTTIATLIGQNRLIDPYNSTVYGANDGTVSMVQGVKVYIASKPQTAASTSTAAGYVAFYELNGNVYAGGQAKAGSVVTRSIGYNAQARGSIQAALTF